MVKLADLGDVLTATPALRELRLGLPAASISALVAPHTARVLAGSSAVDRLWTLRKADYDRPGQAGPMAVARAIALGARLRRAGFHAALLLHHLTTAFGALKYRLLLAAVGAPVRSGLDNGRGGFLTHRVPDRGFGARHEVSHCRAVVHALGVPPRPGLPALEFPITESERRWAAERLTPLAAAGAPLVAVHPGCGARAPERRWSLDGFRRVAAALAADGAGVVAVGGPAERHLAAQVAYDAGARGLSLGGATTLGQLAAVLERCAAFVGGESGVMHLAAAAGTRCVAIFGPGNPAAWGPYPPGRHRVLRVAGRPPCQYVGFHLVLGRRCPDCRCLAEINPAQVVEAVWQILEDE